MKAIKLLHVLLDYDYPQVFVACDPIDVRYVCMISEVADQGPAFLCVPVSARRCDELLSGKIDLRQVYEEPEISEFYLATPDDLVEPFNIERAQMDLVPHELLPEPGLVFSLNDEVSIKAQELNTTVAYASLAVPESVREPRIRTRKLSAFLNIYQGCSGIWQEPLPRLQVSQYPRVKTHMSPTCLASAMGPSLFRYVVLSLATCWGK
ncbi:hypothetical protein I0E98_21965 [Pseudomonas lalucatii]|nr:hypothetical protein [Pseudomonas lalucatii]